MAMTRRRFLKALIAVGASLAAPKIATAALAEPVTPAGPITTIPLPKFDITIKRPYIQVSGKMESISVDLGDPVGMGISDDALSDLILLPNPKASLRAKFQNDDISRIFEMAQGEIMGVMDEYHIGIKVLKDGDEIAMYDGCFLTGLQPHWPNPDHPYHSDENDGKDLTRMDIVFLFPPYPGVY